MIIFPFPKKTKIRGQISENLLPAIPPEITLTVYENTSVIPKDDTLFTESMKKHQFTLEQVENGYSFQYPESLQKAETVVDCLPEVTYTINGRDYISLTAFCAENLPDN